MALTIRVDDLGISIDTHDVHASTTIRRSHGSCLFERNFKNVVRSLQTRPSGPRTGVLREKDLVGGRVPDHCLMEQGIALLAGDEGERRVVPNDLVEFVIVDMEWL